MRKKLKIGNLGSAIDADKLKEIFSEIGNVVRVQLAQSQLSGISRGFGFVEMSSENEANRCIEHFNGKDFFGRTLSVEIAIADKQKEPKKSRMK